SQWSNGRRFSEPEGHELLVKISIVLIEQYEATNEQIYKLWAVARKALDAMVARAARINPKEQERDKYVYMYLLPYPNSPRSALEVRLLDLLEGTSTRAKTIMFVAWNPVEHVDNGSFIMFSGQSPWHFGYLFGSGDLRA